MTKREKNSRHETPSINALVMARIFTLIELLAVISISIIIISMLLPALKSAKNKTSQITCLGNIRQLGTAMCSYSDDYQEYLYPPDTYWPPYIEPYLGKPFTYNIVSSKLWSCSAHPSPSNLSTRQAYKANTRLKSTCARLMKIKMPSIKLYLVEFDHNKYSSGVTAVDYYQAEYFFYGHSTGMNILFTDNHAGHVTQIHEMFNQTLEMRDKYWADN